jgi:dTDP-glucose 4,6-dehydratase
MDVLLTGASGFVGSHTLRHFLLNTDWNIVCPVTFRHKGMQDRIALAMSGIDGAENRVKLVRCDISYPISNITKNDIGHIDYVFNIASESHVDRSIFEPGPFIINNVSLICNMLDWAKEVGVKKFIHVSTDEVYGPAAAGHDHKEWEDLYLPSNPYSASKAAQESIAFSYWRTYGMPIAITNTMNIIGEMQDPEKFVPMVIKKVLAGEEVTIHGSTDGQIGSRFYLHARNQSDALLHISSMDFKTYGESSLPLKYHVVGEKEVSNLEMAELIAEMLGKKLNYKVVDFHSARPGHDLRYGLDGTKLANTGWKHPISLEDSLSKTVDWYLNNPNWLYV